MFSVLFVCMGNICRSPTAEAVFKRMVDEAGLADRVLVDSAGTHVYGPGDAPDAGSVAAGAARGYDLSALTARKLSPYDAERFDLVLAMDCSNYERIVREFGSAKPGPGQRAEVRMFLEFAPGDEELEVPDPYGGEEDGFELVLDLIEEASSGLLDAVRERLAQGSGA